MRIVAGAWRGRRLAAPEGFDTRPTADRVRQALFDMLMHAPWAGREAIEEAVVVDAFAGTGALGLEALSRGAAFVTFLERDRAAVRVLRGNVAACRAEGRSRIVVCDVLSPPTGQPASLIFLDPPYGLDLVPRAVDRLGRFAWIASGALIVAETGRGDALGVSAPLLAERVWGGAKVSVWRAA
jgi:16S rRNA (guanine966-N2)-methyltransferase